MKITYLIGLPGSGKTTFAAGLDGLFLDDLTQTGGHGRLREVPADTKHLIISDIGFLDAHVFAKAQEVINRIIEVKVGEFPEFIYWENDPEQCHKNLEGRERPVSLGFLRFLSSGYHIPKNVTPRSVKY